MGMGVVAASFDLSAAFDTIDHKILLARLETDYGISGNVQSWFASYLSNRFQSVKIGSHFSNWMPLIYGVPQGSVLGPLIFTMYVKPLCNILTKHNMHFYAYADDTQVYTDCAYDDVSSATKKLESCLIEVKKWMTENKLKINDDKTEIILFGHPHAMRQICKPIIVNVNGHDISATNKVKNLGVILDETLSMTHQISSLSGSAYHHIRNISFIRNYITKDITKKLMTSLVLSRLDYCNSLLSGLQLAQLKKLQTVQNNAARVVERARMREEASPLLYKLHWLPLRARIMYKVALFC